MSEVQKGFGVQWAITTTNTTGVGTGVLRHISQTLTNDAEMVEHRNPATGAVEGVTIFNRNRTLEVTVYPSGTTKALANNTAAAMPQSGDNVEIVDSGNSQIAGVYMVERATLNRSTSEAASFNLTLRRWGADAVITAVPAS